MQKGERAPPNNNGKEEASLILLKNIEALQLEVESILDSELQNREYVSPMDRFRKVTVHLRGMYDRAQALVLQQDKHSYIALEKALLLSSSAAAAAADKRTHCSSSSSSSTTRLP